jgi:hypothetical protein
MLTFGPTVVSGFWQPRSVVRRSVGPSRALHAGATSKRTERTVRSIAGLISRFMPVLLQDDPRWYSP